MSSSRAAAVTIAALVPLTACGGPPQDSTDAILIYPADAGPDAVAAPDADISLCSTELPCPAASPGRVSVCGRVRDVETNAVLEQPGATGEPCDPDAPTADGPCSLRLAAYAALDFAGNPTGTPPLPTETYRLDTCGRFVLGNVVRPTLGGYMGIGVHDASGTGDRLLSGAAFATQSAETRTGADVWSLRRTTDDAWQTSSGLAGESFHTRGAVLLLFRHGDEPVSGVTAIVGGTTVPSQDYYFSDSTPDSRTTVAPGQATTGLNGSALVTGTSLVNHGGDGGEPKGCHWVDALSTSIRGVMLVAPRTLAEDFGGACPTGGSSSTVAD
jgi:hypothetical protein